MAAARRFFDKAIRENGAPGKVTMDKSGANKAAVSISTAARTSRSPYVRSNTSTTSSNRTIVRSSA